MSPRPRAAPQRAYGACLLAALWYLGTAATAHSAHAAEGTPVQLNFVGAADCDDHTVLQREVERRSEVVRWVAAGAETVKLDVRIGRGDLHFEALVVVERPGAPPVARAITGSTCQEVIEGAALIVAVLVPPVEPHQPITPVGPARSLPVPRPLVNRESLTWRFGGGAAGIQMWGVAPAHLPGVEAFGDASTYANGWAPSFRVSVRYAARSGFGVGPGDGESAFRLISGVAGACPVAWLPVPAITLRPCVTGALGRLRGSGSGAEGTQTESHPWAAIGPGLRLEAQVLDALSVQVEGTAEVGLFTGRFWFGRAAFHETSRLNERIAVSVVARFPE